MACATCCFASTRCKYFVREEGNKIAATIQAQAVFFWGGLQSTQMSVSQSEALAVYGMGVRRAARAAGGVGCIVVSSRRATDFFASFVMQWIKQSKLIVMMTNSEKGVWARAERANYELTTDEAGAGDRV